MLGLIGAINIENVGGSYEKTRGFIAGRSYISKNRGCVLYL